MATSVCNSPNVSDLQSIAALELALSRSYLTALLLTGDSECAEAAVAIAIEDGRDEELLHNVVSQSLLRIRHLESRAISWPAVPLELRRVVELPPPLRSCYVLGVLVRWPRRVSALMLGISEREVDQRACQAARMLAGFPAKLDRPQLALERTSE